MCNEFISKIFIIEFIIDFVNNFVIDLIIDYNIDFVINFFIDPIIDCITQSSLLLDRRLQVIALHQTAPNCSSANCCDRSVGE